MKQTLEQKIRQRRAQMLVHSYIYYHLNDNIVSDDVWQKWANELVELQKKKKRINFYDKAFSDWTGASGAFLPADHWVRRKASTLLETSEAADPSTDKRQC